MLISYLILILMISVGLGFFTLLERKILSYIQIRKGPNKVGFGGMLQPFSDGMKLFLKEFMILKVGNFLIFMMAPILSLMLCFLNWSLDLLMVDLYDYNFSLLFFFVISSSSAYIVLLSGWSSNSMYAVIGSYRGIAQFISYEVVMGLILLMMAGLVGSYNFIPFIESGGYYLLGLISLMLWMSVMLAEVNRSPYDFVEGESELVSGYNVEYSSGGFSLLFSAEYGNILFMSLMTGYLFGGRFMWLMLFILFSISVIWVRGTFPRLRYDKLMEMAWKFYLSVSLGGFLFMMGVVCLVESNLI